jgi:hypothetical protein
MQQKPERAMSNRTIAADNQAAKLSRAELAELDRQWAAIKAGERTVAHDDVVRWLDT